MTLGRSRAQKPQSARFGAIFSGSPAERMGWMEQPAYFPLFINLWGKRAVVFGGGIVGLRRAQVLGEFGAQVTVVAPAFARELEGVRMLRRAYQPGDCTGYALVVAATDSREVNRAVVEECNALGILVNAADAPGECDFYFPAVARRGSVVAGVTASNTGHHLAARVAQQIRELLGRMGQEEEEVDGKAEGSGGESGQQAGGCAEHAGDQADPARPPGT